MRVVIQRALEASVHSEGRLLSQIEAGLVILLGIEEADSPDDIDWLVGKITRMRIFSDSEGKMNQALVEQDHPAAMVISQFTLHAATRKGNRPSFIRAARPEHAEPLYQKFCDDLESVLGQKVARGRFGADMQLSLVNDGPVTILIDSRNRE
ncbi:MAG: D-aminoacyl-tRNA deacylase [Verrucomicrobiales bacterium]